MEFVRCCRICLGLLRVINDPAFLGKEKKFSSHAALIIGKILNTHCTYQE